TPPRRYRRGARSRFFVRVILATPLRLPPARTTKPRRSALSTAPGTGEVGLVAFQTEDLAATGVHVGLVLLTVQDEIHLVDEEPVLLFEIGVLDGRAGQCG